MTEERDPPAVAEATTEVEEPVVGPEEDVAAQGPPAVQRPPIDRRRLQRNLSWALFLVVIGLVVLFFLLWRGAVADRDAALRVERDRTEVADTATRFLEALTNFSGATIEQDVDRIRSFAIGDFQDQVDQFFDAPAREALRKAKAQSVGKVQSVFVESLSGETASVFAVVQETITNASTTAPKPQTLRIDLQMIETDAGWKVSRVDILQTPGGAVIPGA